MSSEQKAWAEEKEFQLLESSLETLPRNGWLQLDRIKDLINRLN